MNENKQSNSENDKIINTLYSTNKVSEKKNSKTEYSETNKMKHDSDSQKYIKEMHALADKNEFKNNIIVLVLFIVIVSIIVFSILMNTSFKNPKTNVPRNKVVTESATNTTIKPILSQEKIYEYLNVETNRTAVLKKAMQLNKGSKTGVTVYLLSEVLRSNGFAVADSTSTVKQLVTDLTSMDWKKDTDFTKLEKGDICFTTDAPKKPGVPSHTYVFMGWVEDGKTDYANIIDGQVQEYGNILHKRNISISVSEKDKFSFFLRK